MQKTTVTGRLHVGDRAIARGWVQILPTGGTVGTLCSAPLAPEGTFRVTNAPVGLVAIGFAGPMPPPTGDAYIDNFFRAQTTFPLRRTITASGSVLDLDIQEESRLFEKSRQSVH